MAEENNGSMDGFDDEAEDFIYNSEGGGELADQEEPRYRLTDSEEDDEIGEAEEDIASNSWDQSDDDSYVEYRPKRSKKEGPDRISNLPDSIIIHILSFLPMKQVIKTGVLSKRWKWLWTSASTLDFKHQSRLNNGLDKFISSVDKTLVRCSVSHVQKFAVEFPYLRRFAYDVNGWMQFAKGHSINELELKFEFGSQSQNNLYNLPQCVYDNSSLRKLTLSGCKFSANCDNIKWDHLNVLILENIELHEEQLQKILSSCPELEVLELSICRGIRRLDFESTSLRKFVIKDYWGKLDESCLEISAPNIKSLEISGFLYRKMVKIVRAPALVDAKLDFYRSFRDGESSKVYRTNRHNLEDLLRSLQHVENLTIGSWCIQVLTLMQHKAITLTTTLPQLKCKCLTLNSQMERWDIPGTVLLLQISPNLETAVINAGKSLCKEFRFDPDFTSANNFDEKNYLETRFRHIIPVKLIKVCGFWEGKTENIIQFAQVMLKNALMLQKMVIADAIKGRSVFIGHAPLESLQVAQKLLSFPRSSRDAMVFLL